MTLAAAAAVLFFVLRGPAALPAYQLEAARGDSEMRSDSNGPPVHATGSVLDITVRPSVAVDGPVSAKAFVSAGDVTQAVSVALTTAGPGVFRLRGPVDDIALPAVGDQTLYFVVARPEVLPKSVDTLEAGLLKSPRPWQVLEYKFSRQASPSP